MRSRFSLVIACLFSFVPLPLSLYQDCLTGLFFGAPADRMEVGEAAALRNLERPPAAAASVRDLRASVEPQSRPARGGRTRFRCRFPDGVVVEFTARVRQKARGPAPVVAFSGTRPASDLPEKTFARAARRTGVPAEAAAALRFVSQHEGGFDAINTWDRARFSWGFIQFAGGRGLPPLLAHFKGYYPELFQRLLGRYGVDVLPDAEGRPEAVCVDPDTGERLRGAAAERAFGRDPRLIAVFIRAGRNLEVQRIQIECALQEYVRPALAVRTAGVRITKVLRSRKGLAMLIDRKIHEGNVRRLARAVAAVGPGVDLRSAEARVLKRVVREAGRRGERMIQRRLRHIYHSELDGPV